MSDLPKFRLYGDGDELIEEALQPSLSLRDWDALSVSEKENALQYLVNAGWIKDHSGDVLATIKHLNDSFLRQCPGKRLHAIVPKTDSYGRDNRDERIEAAVLDFKEIFKHLSGAMVLRMLSALAWCQIDRANYECAEKETDEAQRSQYTEEAFKKFDKLANCVNHIFDQFAVNQVLTRSGIVPRQDEKITREIYLPTLKLLADPKWRPVSDDLAKMFEDYRDKNYAEVITKGHSAIHRFLQILTGNEGKNAPGEVSKLYSIAKNKGLIPANRFTEPLVGLLQGYFAAERATKSTAKPATLVATPSDSILMMNLVMVFLQYCLQVTGSK